MAIEINDKQREVLKQIWADFEVQKRPASGVLLRPSIRWDTANVLVRAGFVSCGLIKGRFHWKPIEKEGQNV